MSETKSIPESWWASQAALLKAMFPATADASGRASVAAPLQEQFEELRDTWTESINSWSELVKDGVTIDSLKPEALHALFTPERWLGSGAGVFDAGLRQVLEGPKYATLFDLDRKILEMQQLAMQRDKNVAVFQAVLMKGWNSAFARFSNELASSKEKAPSTWRGMADRWLAVVNDTMIDVHRTDEFVQAQKQMLRSASDYRLQERKIAEAWCDALHVPTRSEMDEVQRTVTELRRQVRALQRTGSKAASGTVERATPAKKRAPRSRLRNAASA